MESTSKGTTVPALRTITVALLGNPNTGKSTLFNALAGVHQRVGNYPGVTVEKKIGRMRHGGRDFAIIDLPGTYSLAPRSPDEMVTVDVLLGRQRDVSPPDVIVCIVDASNLPRNLFLVSQALEMGRPTVLALNMVDVAADRGIQIDAALLASRLKLPVVQLQANRRVGVAELKQTLLESADGSGATPPSPFPELFRAEVDALATRLSDGAKSCPRYLAERLLLDVGGYLEHADWVRTHDHVLDELKNARERLASAGAPVPAVEAMSRYQWVGETLDGVVESAAERRDSLTDRIDGVLTHRLWGTLAFILVMVVIFQAIFSGATPLMDLIEGGIERLGESLASSMAEGTLRSLFLDGIVAGVGGVLVFLPQIFILFFFIAVLEDCGYMARAAYLMDRLMSRVGLSGKSFIPLLSSFACAIPGVMAARVIENRRDRLVTVLVAPLMSCSARLPVYTLLIAAFIPDRRWLGGWVGLQGLTMFGAYSIGVFAAIGVALVLKRTILRGATPPFVMELPTYKMPSFRTVFLRMAERGWAFVRRAGTLILAVSVLVWAATFFPHNPEIEAKIRATYASQIEELERQVEALPEVDSVGRAEAKGPLGAEDAAADEIDGGLHEKLDQLRDEVDRRVAGAYVQDSYLGRAGRFIEPAVRPLGWDWRIGCAVIASFPAREVVIGALGVIYNLGDDDEEAVEPLKQRLRNVTWDTSDRLVFNIPVALSIMVFFALCAQCAATLAVIRRETNSWRWPAFTFAYMTSLAYVAALATYHIGMWIGGA